MKSAFPARPSADRPACPETARMLIVERLNAAFAGKPCSGQRYAYGTAGFRGRYDETMHQLFVRVGVIAALRSLDQQLCTGVMVTASHNLEEDNGAKIVDIDGGMLAKEWESWAEQLANVLTAEFVVRADARYSELTKKGRVPAVMIGEDTRPHSAVLVDAVRSGVEALGGQCLILGQVITPVVHFCVDAYNKAPPSGFSATAAVAHYFDELLQGYRELLATATVQEYSASPLVLDTSFGVGSVVVDQFLAHVGERGLTGWQIDVRNRAGAGSVNAGCGAEHAQKLQLPPCGVSPQDDADKLLCSFDGDGDRIVFHAFAAKAGRWVLLDGDRIASLLAAFLQRELQAAGIAASLSMGVVQTAYANGASTAFLRSFQPAIPVLFAKTGVKYLHHAAKELDVGVYFEANGHGTVSFSQRARDLILTEPDAPTTDDEGAARAAVARTRLRACLRVINQTVGDALSDMLACLAILKLDGWTHDDWAALYCELPSRQVKVVVADKARLRCTNDEMRLEAPAVLQADLDEAMARVQQGRCFLRPSGTEDVVRIYAEAATAQGVDELVASASALLAAFSLQA